MKKSANGAVASSRYVGTMARPNRVAALWTFTFESNPISSSANPESRVLMDTPALYAKLYIPK